MAPLPPPVQARPFRDAALALAACAAVTLLALPLAGILDLSNIVMLFLLAVALVAVKFGRAPAVVASIASVLLFDFFFVDPRFSLAVQDAQYLVTFGVMLVVALIIGELTARLRREAVNAVARENQTHALYELARDLSGAISVQQVAMLTRTFVGKHLDARSALLLPGADGRLSPVGERDGEQPDLGVANRVFETGTALPFLDRRTSEASLALPLQSPLQVRGVLVVASPDREVAVPAPQQPLLETVASLVAIVVERLHFVSVAHDALLDVESERLRNSLLSAVSHDLRTPLTVLVGLADALAHAHPALPQAQADAANVIREQSLRMSRLVENLLDMARLQAGRVQLRKDWQPLEEVVGSSVKDVEARLASRLVRIDIPADLPLLEFDAVLIERVLANLLDNAIKYAPEGPIAVSARQRGNVVEVEVADEGPGLVPGTEEQVFAPFERGRSEGDTAGAGMGLAICRAIVAAHGGTIVAANGPRAGARVTFTLPVGTPPAFDPATSESAKVDAR